MSDQAFDGQGHDEEGSSVQGHGNCSAPSLLYSFAEAPRSYKAGAPAPHLGLQVSQSPGDSHFLEAHGCTRGLKLSQGYVCSSSEASQGSLPLQKRLNPAQGHFYLQRTCLAGLSQA